MFRPKYLSTAIAVLSISSPNLVNAATFNFSALIESVVVQGTGGDIDTAGITAGSTVVNGTFSYDESQAPFFDNGQQTSYNDVVASVNLPNQVFSISYDQPDYRTNSAGASGVSVYNDAFAIMYDQIDVEPSTLTQDMLTGIVSDSRIYLSFSDPTATAFNDTSLPIALSLNDFATRRFVMWDRTSGFDLPTNTTRLTGTVLSVDLAPVPLPASMPLLGASLFLGGAYMRRQQKRK